MGNYLYNDFDFLIRHFFFGKVFNTSSCSGKMADVSFSQNFSSYGILLAKSVLQW